MPRVLRVSFRQAGRLYQFDAGDLNLAPGDRVVAETSRGRELGTVRTEPAEIPRDKAAMGLKRIARKASESDLRKLAENAAREQQAMEVAAKKIEEHGLPMKLIAAEKVLEGNYIVLHFTAESRVDFRALVRDLARALHSRIELHQVGVRDEAKLLGGIGPCGRALCCATFMTEFDPVGIKMAKAQDLSLPPKNLGRLRPPHVLPELRVRFLSRAKTLAAQDRQPRRNRAGPRQADGRKRALQSRRGLPGGGAPGRGPAGDHLQ